MKPSQILEGENSSLRKAFEEATEKCQCKEMSCPPDCNRKHTCHTYSCYKCESQEEKHPLDMGFNEVVRMGGFSVPQPQATQESQAEWMDEFYLNHNVTCLKDAPCKCLEDLLAAAIATAIRDQFNNDVIRMKEEYERGFQAGINQELSDEEMGASAWYRASVATAIKERDEYHKALRVKELGEIRERMYEDAIQVLDELIEKPQ